MRASTSPMDLCHDLCNVSHELGAGYRDASVSPVEWADYFSRYRESAANRQECIVHIMKELDYDDYCYDFRMTDIPTWRGADTYHETEGTNHAWSHGIGAFPVRYVVSSHSDHIAGKGAVDNASGMAVMAKVAAELRNRIDILFACFDGEELGLRGSYAFFGLMHQDLRQVSHVFNIDSIGKGALVNFAPSFQKQTLPGLQRVEYTGMRTDANSFTSLNTAVGSLMTVGHFALPRLKQERVLISEEDSVFANVANQARDQIDQLCEGNMKKAVDYIVKTIRDHTQGLLQLSR